MPSLDDNMSLTDAIAATEHLTLRELDAHVRVGPMPSGTVLPIMLPLKQFLGIKDEFFVLSLIPKINPYAFNVLSAQVESKQSFHQAFC